MKSLDLYKEEIFRRSEQKIAKRKKRRRIIAAVLPICICVAAAAVALPQLIPQGEDAVLYSANGQAVAESAIETASEIYNSSSGLIGSVENGNGQYSLAYGYISLEISDGENAMALTDAEKITELYSLIGVYIDKYAMENIKSAPIGSSSKAYTVVFTAATGERVCYFVCGNKLGQADNFAVTLSDAEMAELKAALGISG